MRYEIVFAPAAVDAYKKLAAHIRSQVRDALESHLRYEPTKVTKSRIKKLRGLSRPQYRLRVDQIRDVKETTVEMLAIVDKENAQVPRSGRNSRDRKSLWRKLRMISQSTYVWPREQKS
jgi:mRNA interferase RelE/StbE